VRIAVTGAAGFIGSHLVRALTEDGHSIVAIDSNEYGLGFLGAEISGVDEVWEDVGHWVQNFGLRDVELVIHLAIKTGPRSSVAGEAATACLLFEACSGNGPDIILQSSASIYAPDIRDAALSESARVEPTDLYAAAKAMVEALASAYRHSHQLPVTIVRPVSVYGARQFPRWLVPRTIWAALEGQPVEIWGDGNARRDWLYIDDLCNAYRKIISNLEATRGQVFNVGTGTESTVQEVVRLILERVGSAQVVHRRPRAGDVHAECADIAKIESVLGWRPQVSFPEGIDRTVGWYVEHRDWLNHAWKAII